MTLGELVGGLANACLDGDGSRVVTGITHDSRRVEKDWVFAALPGQHTHGLEFVLEAMANGAGAVLTDCGRPSSTSIPWIKVPSARKAMAHAAWAIAGDPQRELLLMGITGTNGKSTTAHLLSLILEAEGRGAAFFGTLGYFLPGGDSVAAERTTPEATDLAPLLRRTVGAGGRAVAMEVSSHALMMDRLAGLRFQVAVWTNLSRDHLDFHGDMESYYWAKRRLFDDLLADDGRRVLPVDDPWGARMFAEPRDGDVAWGLSSGVVHACEVRADLGGTEFELSLAGEDLPIRLSLNGPVIIQQWDGTKWNFVSDWITPMRDVVRTMIVAAAAAYAAGVGGEAICSGLQRAHPLSGRLECVTDEPGFPILVDFAHTPDGLQTVVRGLRELTDRRLRSSREAASLA